MDPNRLARLQPALHALWHQAVTTKNSGALALLEPRLTTDGPRLRTDGHTLWVDADALEAWLEASGGFSEGTESLAATGLEVLYAWRGEPGPWVRPFVPVDPVLTVSPQHDKGDWLKQRLLGGEKTPPQPHWERTQWWHEQARLLMGTRTDVRDALEGSPDWEQPLMVQTPGESIRAWWKAVREHHQWRGQPRPEQEREWLTQCLTEQPESLDEWMALEPAVAVPYDGLLLLDEPRWVDAFIERGANLHAQSVGQTAVGMAATRRAHMLMPLLQAGVPALMPLEELLVTLITGDHTHPQAIQRAIEAGRGLLALMDSQGEPMDWKGKSELIAPMLSKALQPNQARAFVLEGLWPKSLRLDKAIPQAQAKTGRKGRIETLPLAFAAAIWAVESIERYDISQHDLSLRLHALALMGVDFSRTTPGGGVFHEALLTVRRPTTPQLLYELLEPLGADWEAVDAKGLTALEQKQWFTSTLKQSLLESFKAERITAQSRAKRMERALPGGGENFSERRRL